METEKLLIKTFAKEFKDCTVIAIAHRLRSMQDFNRVVEISNGRAEEMSKDDITFM